MFAVKEFSDASENSLPLKIRNILYGVRLGSILALLGIFVLRIETERVFTACHYLGKDVKFRIGIDRFGITGIDNVVDIEYGRIFVDCVVVGCEHIQGRGVEFAEASDELARLSERLLGTVHADKVLYELYICIRIVGIARNDTANEPERVKIIAANSFLFRKLQQVVR